MANESTAANYTALITGASSGIGLELAKIFAQNGHNLVLVARSEEKLDNLALQFAVKYKIYTKVIAKDLAKPEAPQQVFDLLKQEGTTVDVLVNNAGFGAYGHFKDTDTTKELNMMQLNMVALTHLCKLFLHQLPQGREGKILNVSSMAAFMPGPLMAVYYATKAYVQSFSEALAAELAESNVQVTVLCPGPTDTGFKENADLEGSGLFNSNFVADAEQIARAGYEALMKGEVVVIPKVQNRLAILSTRLVPRSLLRNMVMRLQEKRH